MLRRQALLCLVGMIGLSLGHQRSAEATIDLLLTDTSGGSSLLQSSGTNLVSFSGVVGQYTVTITSASSVATGELHVTNLTVSRNSIALPGDILTIQLGANGYTMPAGSPLSLTNTTSATFTQSTSGDMVTYKTFGDSTNSLTFGAGVPTPTSSVTSPGGTTGSTAGPTTLTTFTNPGTYSLNAVMTIFLQSTTAHVDSTGAGVTSAVPEPASTALALTGLPVLGLLWARRRRQRD
jgi:hypothetical protein